MKVYSEIVIFATLLAPIILSLTELLKLTFKLNKNLLPAVSFVVGLAVGVAAFPFTDLDSVLRLWAGGLAGLAASGLFDLGKRTIEYVKEEKSNE